MIEKENGQEFHAEQFLDESMDEADTNIYDTDQSQEMNEVLHSDANFAIEEDNQNATAPAPRGHLARAQNSNEEWGRWQMASHREYAEYDCIGQTAFGVGNQWVYRFVDGSRRSTCRWWPFDDDPAPGAYKQCFCQSLRCKDGARVQSRGIYTQLGCPAATAVRTVNLCLDMIQSYQGGSSGYRRVCTRVTTGRSSSRSLNRQTEASINSQVEAAYNGVTFRGSASVQANYRTAMQSAMAQSSHSESVREECMRINMNRPAYIYQGRTEVTMDDFSTVTTRGIFMQRSEYMQPGCHRVQVR